MTAFANAEDKNKERHYFVANNQQEIDKHCRELELTIIRRPEYVDPIMVSNYFIWVGEGPRPPQWKISRPPKRS